MFKGSFGIFLTLKSPTREMIKEAAAAGFYETYGQKVPRLQILTASDIFTGKLPKTPFGHIEGPKGSAREIEVQAKLF
jgi:site-specific DNA-methyltransferase (adenine-specific)